MNVERALNKVRFFLFKNAGVHEGCAYGLQRLLEGASVDVVYADLRHRGYSDGVAARIVTFLPSAFARAYYEPVGHTFPDHFFPGQEAYRRRRFIRYCDEPIFQAALQLAKALRREQDDETTRRIVDLSAEHKGIETARASGLGPTGTSLIIYNF